VIPNNLQTLLHEYKEALSHLEAIRQQATKQQDNERILSLLLKRHYIARTLARLLSRMDFIDPGVLVQLASLDDRLKSQAELIERIVGKDRLRTWSDAIQAPSSAWWWFLDREATAKRKPGLGTVVVAGLLLTASIGLATEIATRLLSVGPDFFSVVSLIVQSILTIIAGTAFLRLTRSRVEGLFSQMHIAPKYYDIARVGLSLLVFLVALAARLLLPTIAEFYNKQGILNSRAGRETSAITDFKRAISLKPDFADAHYNLGDTYEEIVEYDMALSEYISAILADPQMYSAYNNLARLYIRHKKQPADALNLLNAALERKTALPTSVQYALLKNRAWANLELGYFEAVKEDLRQAFALMPRGSAAHCLYAQLIERQENSQPDVEMLRGEWESCLRYSNTDDVKPEVDWVSLAKERLSEERR
jgi:tetratricopeptide (TPR) repeat protein